MMSSMFWSSLRAVLSPLVRLLPELKNKSLLLKSCSLSVIIDSRAGGPVGLKVDANLNLRCSNSEREW